MNITKIPKREYTAELKELAVKRVKDGQTAGAVAKELGLIEQTLRNWVKAFDAGKLNGLGTKKAPPEEMYVFIDTEFTSLDSFDAQLISIAMVTQESSFYAESSEFEPDECSDFVQRHVLPLLDAPEQLTQDEIGRRAKVWLAQFGSVTLLTDAPDYDWRFVQRIFRNVGWPANLRHNPGDLYFARHNPAVDHFFQNAVACNQKGSRAHHALDDALANLNAYQDTRLSYRKWKHRF